MFSLYQIVKVRESGKDGIIVNIHGNEEVGKSYSVEMDRIEYLYREKELEATDMNDIYAARLLRRYKVIKDKVTEKEVMADEEIQAINNWLKLSTEDEFKEMEDIESILSEYYTRKRLEDNKFRLDTAYGSVKGRKQKPKIVKKDKELLEWLEANNKEYIKEEVIKKPLWGEFKKQIKIVNGLAVDENGEIVEGVEVEERDPFNIKLEVNDI